MCVSICDPTLIRIYGSNKLVLLLQCHMICPGVSIVVEGSSWHLRFPRWMMTGKPPVAQCHDRDRGSWQKRARLLTIKTRLSCKCVSDSGGSQIGELLHVGIHSAFCGVGEAVRGIDMN